MAIKAQRGADAAPVRHVPGLPLHALDGRRTSLLLRHAVPAAIGYLLLLAHPARAEEALLCDDRRIVVKLQSGYTASDARAKVRVEKPREVAYAAPPAAARATFEKARYCEAQIVVSNGEADTAYYRLNVLKGGKAQDWVEPCFKKINEKGALRDGCADHRPPK